METRRSKEGDKVVAYRCYVNLGLFEAAASSVQERASVLTELVNSSPDNVYIVTRDTDTIIFEVKTGHVVNGLCAVKTLRATRTGEVALTFAGQEISPQDIGIATPIVPPFVSLWENFVHFRPCIGVLCSQNVARHELWQEEAGGAVCKRSRSKNCLGFILVTQNNSSCAKCMNSRPTQSIPNAPSEDVKVALEGAGCSRTTTTLVTNMVENADKPPNQKRWKPE